MERQASEKSDGEHDQGLVQHSQYSPADAGHRRTGRVNCTRIHRCGLWVYGCYRRGRRRGRLGGGWRLWRTRGSRGFARSAAQFAPLLLGQPVVLLPLLFQPLLLVGRQLFHLLVTLARDKKQGLKQQWEEYNRLPE